MRVLKQTSRIPGFGMTLSVTLFYLSIILVLPLTALIVKASDLTYEQLLATLQNPRILAACRLSILAALGATLVNAVFGTLLAWVLTRYSFPGRAWIDGLVDLPVALPTAVAGLALTAIYSPNASLGSWLESHGLKIAYTPYGVFLALIFVGLPLLVRTVQPVLQDIEKGQEEAAHTLGASEWQSFRFVMLPQLLPAILTGMALAFGRAVGEYGSVIFIAGNVPLVSEIAPLLIVSKLEQFDFVGATAIALILLSLSLSILLIIHRLQALSQRYREKELRP